MQFGPDGYLYIGMGDGGSSNNPLGLSQNFNTCGSKNCCEYSVLFHNHNSIRIYASFYNSNYEQIRYGKDAARGRI